MRVRRGINVTGKRLNSGNNHDKTWNMTYLTMGHDGEYSHGLLIESRDGGGWPICLDNLGDGIYRISPNECAGHGSTSQQNVRSEI